MLRKLSVVCLGAAALVVTSAGVASAGEITGNGKVVHAPQHAASVCSFSGLNDDTAEDPSRTQNYGQLVRQGLKPYLPSAGEACNPNSGFEE
ncbi:hypothetical protein ACI79J_01905 [Geodermatophilus sp. SYSU D01062]